jgi:NitT/TauT family transport system substrate-binding protein
MCAAYNLPEAVVNLSYVRLVTFGDNLNFFGLNPNYTGVTADKVWRTSVDLYKHAGRVSGSMPTFRDVSNLSILKAIRDRGLLTTSGIHAPEAAPEFVQTGKEATAPQIGETRLNINFDTNSAILDQNAMSKIDESMFLNIVKNSRAKILLEGNTDNTGSDAVNDPLSRQRAESVKRYLVGTHKINPTRITAVGNGSHQPVADNASDSGRSQNRRTDFSILNYSEGVK